MDFQISGLNVDQFTHLFGRDPETLAELGVDRIVADSKPGYPCRVSLQDVEVGEVVLLFNYEHQSAVSPYRSSHAIYVREWAKQAAIETNSVPVSLRHRLLSVRAFDGNGYMVDADIVDGREVESLIRRTFTNNSVAYLHIHNAKQGCYAAHVQRC